MNTTRSLQDILVDTPQQDLVNAIRDGADASITLPLLEAELQRSSLRLQRLKEHRNSLASPMYCLQPEILSDILFTYASNNDELYNLRWTRVLLVCKRWYNIAKDIQSLWSFIEITTARNPPSMYALSEQSDARDARRVETQRSRAGLSPLNIRLRAYGPPSDTKLAYASMFWEPIRVTSLDIGGEPTYLEKIVRSMASHQHTQLKSLMVVCYVGPDTDIRNIQTPLTQVLSNKVPCLRHLKLFGLPIDLSSLHGLRSLQLSFDGPLLFRVDLQDITSALSRCPGLEVLSIMLPMHSQSETDVAFSEVPMLHLRDIVVQSTVQACARLLPALMNMPASAKISAITGRVAESSAISALASYLGHHAARKGAPTIRSIAMTKLVLPIPAAAGVGPGAGPLPLDNSISRLGLSGHKLPNKPGETEYYRPLYTHGSFYIGLDTEVPLSMEEEYMSNILQSWPLARTTHFDMRGALMTQSYLAMFFANLPAATTAIVRLESSNATCLLAYLHAQLQEHGRRVVAHVIFDTQGVVRHGIPISPSEGIARRNLIRMLGYCEEAAREGAPLDIVEIVNEPHEPRDRVIRSTEEVDWSELYRHLQVGIIYEGILHSSIRDLDGTKMDSFAVVDE